MRNIIDVKNVSKSFKIPHAHKSSGSKTLFSRVLRRTRYEEFVALRNISFSIKPGEFVGIVGNNGSGKSTLLKLLSGIYEPDSGTINVNGHISPFLELGVGFNAELTARENVYLNGSILGLSEKELHAKFMKIISFAELTKFIDTKLKNFSSGMYVRLAFSIAMEAAADVYIMDEVLAVGDLAFQNKCIKTFEQYKRKGKTIVLVSHDTSKIQQFCDRVLMLDAGKITNMGEPKDVIAKYIEAQSTFVPYSGDNRAFTIQSVELLDNTGEKTLTLSTGDSCQVKLQFTKNSTEASPHFILALRNSLGIVVFATNTLIDMFETSQTNSEIILELYKLPLKTGKYTIEASIINNKHEKYDFKYSAIQFEVIDNRNTRGIVEIDHKWSIIS